MSTYMPPGIGAIVRAVESKLRESVSPADYGAVGDGMVDDTVALTHLLAQSVPIVLKGTFRITSPITINNPNLAIDAAGAAIKYDGLVGSAWVLRVNGANVFTVRGQLSIDCAGKAGIGIEVRGIVGAALVDISGVTVTNCSSASLSGAAGIQVLVNSGTGKVARVAECVVSNVTRTIANAACAGIVVEHFDVTIVHNNDVSNVLTGTGSVDADGIKLFSHRADSDGDTYSKCSASVRNNRVRNCEGRWAEDASARLLCR